jgi:hypothetical protein
MQEILEIVSLSILRMKRAYSKSEVKLEPCCMLVHQNVDAVEANEKLEDNRSAVRECLDKAARAACIMEGYSETEVKSFSDIIDFDISSPRYVWYIPALWKGNVPMAAVNPLYASKLLELKEGIFTLLKEKGTHFLTTPLLHSHLKDVWSSILQEDFVFSFKNCLEVNAYQFLIRNYVEWDLDIRNKCHEFESMAEAEMKTLSLNENQIIQTFRTKLSNEYERIHREGLLSTFENAEYKKLLLTWRTRFEMKFKCLYEERLEDGVRHIRCLLRYQQIISEFKKAGTVYSDSLKLRVKEFVQSSFDGTRLDSEDKRRETFEKMWSGWIEELKFKHPAVVMDKIKIDVRFDDIVADTFSHGSTIRTLYNKMTEEQPRNKTPEKSLIQHLYGYVTKYLINPLDFIRDKKAEEAQVNEFTV